MPLVRLFTLIAIFLTSLHFLGPKIMASLSHLHIIAKVLFFMVLVALVELGLWVAMTGPSNLVKQLQKSPKETFLDLRTSILKLSIIHILLLILLLSAFLKS